MNISKKEFINKLNIEDISLASIIFDKIMLCKKIENISFVPYFCTPNVWKRLAVIAGELEVKVFSFGVFKEAERRIIAFSPYECTINYPIDLLKVSSNTKFNKIGHRDYLGALMALGIKRVKLGDLVINKEVCYFPICSDLTDYICTNLNSVGKCSCSVSIVLQESELDLENNFSLCHINVASMRIDCIASELCNISRTACQEVIKSGKVLIDYESCRNDKIVNEGSIITIRGSGKYKVMESTGFTKSGKCKLTVKKYI
jgi:RNA-binding protein YlmH